MTRRDGAKPHITDEARPSGGLEVGVGEGGGWRNEQSKKAEIGREKKKERGRRNGMV